MHAARVLTTFLLAASALLAAAGAWGQGYPNRPIRVIVPGPAGTSPDVLVRLYSQHLQGQLGATIIVDNRPGAGGMIGSELVAKATPDGYTLLYTSSAIVLNQIVHARVPYNVMRDFVPLALSTRLPGSLFLVPASLPVQSMPELIAMVKNSGQPLRWGAPGVGNVIHIIGMQFGARVGIPVLNVPYKGAPQIVAALINGEVHATVSSITAVAPFVKAGQLRPLAYTGRTRWPAMPELPTMNEAGVKDFVTLGSWDGWFLPARTPDAIVQRLNGEIRRTLQLPSVQQFAGERGGNEVVGSTPAEFVQFIDSELKRYADLIRELGIRIE